MKESNGHAISERVIKRYDTSHITFPREFAIYDCGETKYLATDRGSHDLMTLLENAYAYLAEVAVGVVEDPPGSGRAVVRMQARRLVLPIDGLPIRTLRVASEAIRSITYLRDMHPAVVRELGDAVVSAEQMIENYLRENSTVQLASPLDIAGLR